MVLKSSGRPTLHSGFQRVSGSPLATGGPQFDALGPNPRCSFEWCERSVFAELNSLSFPLVAQGVKKRFQADPVWFLEQGGTADERVLTKMNVDVQPMVVQFLLCKVVEGIELVELSKPAVWRDTPQGPAAPIPHPKRRRLRIKWDSKVDWETQMHG